jgi:hypothetical protein
LKYQKKFLGIHVRVMKSEESTFNIIIMQHASQDQMMDSIKIEAGQTLIDLIHETY